MNRSFFSEQNHATYVQPVKINFVRMTFYLILITFMPFILNGQSLQQLSELYGKGMYAEVIQTGNEMLKNSYTNEVNLIVGRALADTKEYDTAIPYLQKATSDTITQKWIPAWAKGYLGNIYMVKGDYEQAKKYLEAAVALNATRNSSNYANKRLMSLPNSEAYKDWETQETEHFRFHFQGKDQIKNIDRFVSDREKAYETINQFFGLKLARKIEYFIWNDRNEAMAKLGAALGFAMSELFVIHSANDQTKGHEMTHVISDHAINPKLQSRLINEGVAVYFDQTGRNRLETAQQACKGADISIEKLLNSPQDEYVYPVGGAFIEFLAAKGTSEQLKSLLYDQSLKNAQIVYPNFKELTKEFEAKLKVSPEKIDDDLIKSIVFNAVDEYPVIKLTKDLEMNRDSNFDPMIMEKKGTVEISSTRGIVIDASDYLKAFDPGKSNFMVSIDSYNFELKPKDGKFIVDRNNMRPMRKEDRNFLGFWGDGAYRVMVMLHIFEPGSYKPEMKHFMLNLRMKEF